MRKRAFVALPYRWEIHVCSVKELPRYKAKHLNGANIDMDGEACTFCLTGASGGGLVLVVLPNRYDEDDSWHEALHASTFILHAHSVAVDHEHDETLAYMQAYIKRTCCKLLYGRE